MSYDYTACKKFLGVLKRKLNPSRGRIVRSQVPPSREELGRQNYLQQRAGWKYMRIYNPQRRPRVLVIKCRTDSSQRGMEDDCTTHPTSNQH
ncbi:hypothetical protein TNCV_3103241 [Trichonephila clavipes]|nr:hypothetical protein TNCV_3103241 [Trichonephila clavipes]